MNHLDANKKVYYVDIDNTICKTEGTDYVNAVPYPDRIEKINKLFQMGHKIVYWTARGTKSGFDYLEMTANQLMKWNVYFHEIQTGKPAYDVWIDDRAINSETYFNNDEQQQ